MTAITVTAKVGADGVLHLDVPLGEAEAGSEVQVTVQTALPPGISDEWRAIFERTWGKWSGDFERPPRGEIVERDPL